MRRYGSLTDFSEPIATYAAISRATGVKYQTVKDCIERYHFNGNSYDHDVFKRKPGKRKLPAELEQELVSYEVLNDMRFLSMEKRSVLI